MHSAEAQKLTSPTPLSSGASVTTSGSQLQTGLLVCATPANPAAPLCPRAANHHCTRPLCLSGLFLDLLEAPVYQDLGLQSLVQKEKAFTGQLVCQSLLFHTIMLYPCYMSAPSLAETHASGAAAHEPVVLLRVPMPPMHAQGMLPLLLVVCPQRVHFSLFAFAKRQCQHTRYVKLGKRKKERNKKELTRLAIMSPVNFYGRLEQLWLENKINVMVSETCSS